MPGHNIDHAFGISFFHVFNRFHFLLIKPIATFSVIIFIGDKNKIRTQQAGVAARCFFNIGHTGIAFVITVKGILMTYYKFGFGKGFQVVEQGFGFRCCIRVHNKFRYVLCS